MALKQTINKTCAANADFNGISVEVGSMPVQDTFVIRVKQLSATKEKVVAKVFFDGEKIKYEKIFNFAPNLEGKNFIAQTYEYLKTLPEFEGSVDC
jgi:hypothetical protein